MSLHEQLPHAEHTGVCAGRRVPSVSMSWSLGVWRPDLARPMGTVHAFCSCGGSPCTPGTREHGVCRALGLSSAEHTGRPPPALPWPRQGVHVCRCVCRCVCRYVCTCTCDFAELCVLKKPRMTGLEVVHRRPWQARWPHRSAEVWLWPASVSGHLQTSALSRRTEAEGRAARSGCLERQRTGDCAAKRRRHKRTRFGVRTSWRGVAGLFA